MYINTLRFTELPRSSTAYTRGQVRLINEALRALDAHTASPQATAACVHKIRRHSPRQLCDIAHSRTRAVALCPNEFRDRFAGFLVLEQRIVKKRRSHDRPDDGPGGELMALLSAGHVSLQLAPDTTLRNENRSKRTQ